MIRVFFKKNIGILSRHYCSVFLTLNFQTFFFLIKKKEIIMKSENKIDKFVENSEVMNAARIKTYFRYIL